MKIIFKLVFLLTLLQNAVFAQSSEIENLINSGIALYDNGDYKGAIEQYKKALDLDKKSFLANYEIANTYFALGEYDKAINYADILIALKADYIELAYVLKGSALDQLKKPDDAIKVYKKGIKNFPKNYLLHYNLDLTYFNIQSYKEAEVELYSSLKIKPLHSSSHLLLAYVMQSQGNRIKTLLPLYNFLLIEPTSRRAAGAYNILMNELNKGITKEGEKKININLPSNNEKDEFGSAELMLSLLIASNSTEKNKDKTEAELFTDNSKLLFSMLGDMKKNNKGFWWDYYVDFFYNMSKANHTETFCYYISQSNADENITTWLKDNDLKVDALSTWLEEYSASYK